MKLLGAMLGCALVFTATSSAKEIHPGDLRICGSARCRTVTRPAQARAFSDLLWGPSRVVRAPTPRIGSPIFQLRFKDGPAGAIISATAIRVHGLFCGRFQRGKWYRLLTSLRGITTGLKPKRLRASVPRSC
jgi:hypothetical protein